MNSKNPYEIVAVKCEGPFTEWYSPFFKEPYNDNDEYRKYYDEHIIDIQPVIGPSLNEEDDEECINDDLDCLSDRMMCAVSGDWTAAKKWFEQNVKQALEFGTKITLEYPECGKFVFTPYRRFEMPKPNENHLKVYGPYADLVRQRVAEI